MQTSKIKRFINSIELLLSPSRLGVKYSRSKETQKNWGDALNAWLIPKMSGKEIMHSSEYLNTGLYPTLGGIGSILDNNGIRNLHVWGSGLKSGDSAIPVLPAKIAAVRGRLTQKRLKGLGVACPDVFGDGALVMPRFYNPAVRDKKYKLGIIPHYADKHSALIKPLEANHDVKIIDIESGIEDFVDTILECEVIASSSLHGLIAADAYGVPRVWLKLSDDIAGGNFKFQDYFSTTDVTDTSFLKLGARPGVDEMVRHAVQPQRIADIDKLIEAFPF